MFQEKIIAITNRELKDIISFLKAYHATMDKVFNETKKRNPSQSVLLSTLSGEITDVKKLIEKLERK